MNNTLRFTISEMREVHGRASEYYKNYADAIAQLKAEIDALSNNWTSDETGTYQAFKAKFDEKSGTLDEAAGMMNTFCQNLESKMNELDDAATTAKNLFN